MDAADGGDEAAGLRGDLTCGRWERLTDPLLPVLLLADAGGWWSFARAACADFLVMACPCAPDDVEEECSASHLAVTWPADQEKRSALHPDVIEANLRWSAERLRHSTGCEAQRDALAVLLRWPAG